MSEIFMNVQKAIDILQRSGEVGEREQEILRRAFQSKEVQDAFMDGVQREDFIRLSEGLKKAGADSTQVYEIVQSLSIFSEHESIKNFILEELEKPEQYLKQQIIDPANAIKQSSEWRLALAEYKTLQELQKKVGEAVKKGYPTQPIIQEIEKVQGRLGKAMNLVQELESYKGLKKHLEDRFQGTVDALNRFIAVLILFPSGSDGRTISEIVYQSATGRNAQKNIDAFKDATERYSNLGNFHQQIGELASSYPQEIRGGETDLSTPAELTTNIQKVRELVLDAKGGKGTGC